MRSGSYRVVKGFPPALRHQRPYDVTEKPDLFTSAAGIIDAY